MPKIERRFSIMSHSAKDAIGMWHRQYGFASRSLADGSNSGDISKRLRDLKRPTRKQVEAIIGSHGGWTTIWCQSCHEYYQKVASFGCDDYSVEVCEGCLRAGLKALVGQGKVP